MSSTQSVALAEAKKFGGIMKDRNVQEIAKFEMILNEAGYHEKAEEIAAISSWLDRIFGNVDASGQKSKATFGMVAGGCSTTDRFSSSLRPEFRLSDPFAPTCRLQE